MRTRRSIYKSPPRRQKESSKAKKEQEIESEKKEGERVNPEENEELESSGDEEIEMKNDVPQDSEDSDDENMKGTKSSEESEEEESEDEEVEKQADSKGKVAVESSDESEKSEDESDNEENHEQIKSQKKVIVDSSEEDSEENEETSNFVVDTAPASAKSDEEDSNLFFISTQPNAEAEAQEAEESEDSGVENTESETVKKSKKRKKQAIKEEGRKYPKYNKDIEQSLEKFLFGKPSNLEKQESSEDEEEEETKQKPQWSSIKALDSDSSDNEEKPASKKAKKAAWHDEDDDHLQVKDVTSTFSKAKGKHGRKETSTENYAQSLRKQFSNLMDKPKWADLEKRLIEEDSDDEFFRETTETLASGKSYSLKKGFIEHRKLKDMNYSTHNEGAIIRCAEFHPKNAIGLVAGNNGTASLFQIDGKANPKLQSVHFENFPIKTAHFTADGKQFLVGSQHFGHFFAYDLYKGQSIRIPWKEDKMDQHSMQRFEVNPVNDLVAFQGRFGNIHLMSARTRSKIFSLKMNDNVGALTFSPDGEHLFSHGVGGEVYIWDLKAQECVHKFVDDGCIKGTSLATSRNNRYLACGSDSGVVNIYNRTDYWKQTHPTPEKIVLNLTTSVTSIKFNPTSEVLAMASEVKDNAVKLLHLPSMTVFSNFPSFNFNFKRPNCIDFSMNGGYFSIGNNRGSANLYRFKHYGNY